MEKSCLCALGKTAAYPVLSTLKYFEDEYKQHVEQKKCPAGVCKALITYSINDNCTGCMLCKSACPVEAITGEKKKGDTWKIDQAKCDRCGVCIQSCKFDAIEVA